MNKLIFKKKGLIYEPDKTSIYPTHAVLPFINQSDKNSYLHFASRDIDNKAHSFRVEIEDNLSFRIKSKPSLLLKPGDIGFFDQHGAISSSIIDYRNKKFMYYIGWSRGHEDPLFYSGIGLAVSDNGGLSYKKVSNSPIIHRDNNNPILMTSPHVFIDKDGDFKMVYVSGVKWERINNKLQSFYRLCSAVSNDGLKWNKCGNIVLDFYDNISNYARPWVICIDGKYVLFYSYKSPDQGYKIGVAISQDFVKWERLDLQIEFTGHKSNFDNKMQCYTSLFIKNENLYMLYNGNKFGYAGAGLSYTSLLNFKKFF